MSKRLPLFFLFASLLLGVLGACQSKTDVVQPTLKASIFTPTPPAATATSTSAATVTPTITLTAAPAATPTAPPQPAASSPTSTPSTSQASMSPTPTPPWQIPKVQKDDWVKGNPDAGLVLVEYSDFQ